MYEFGIRKGKAYTNRMKGVSKNTALQQQLNVLRTRYVQSGHLSCVITDQYPAERSWRSFFIFIIILSIVINMNSWTPLHIGYINEYLLICSHMSGNQFEI